MGKFRIQKVEPSEIKDEVYGFWGKYLPGTPIDRFDWLQNNPEGSTDWLFAFDVENNELAGMVSIMRHDLFVDGKVKHAGIIGDFMVSDKYRVFGPALQLQKAVIEYKNDVKLELLYTVPNASSLKLGIRAGYLEKIQMRHMIRPLKTELYLLQNRNKTYIKTLGCKIIDNILKNLPIGKYITQKDQFIISHEIDSSFEEFWQKYKSEKDVLLGNRCKTYLDWRYCRNPVSDFTFLKYFNNESNNLLGYIVYCVSENKISIYDLVAHESKYIDVMLKKLIYNAYNDGCQAIYIRLSKTNPVIHKLKKFMFMDAKDDISVLIFDDKKDYIYDDWLIYESDRNI
jgi:hypothetical protein